MPIIVLRTGDAVPEVAARRGEFLKWISEHIGGAWDGRFLEHDARTEAPLPDARAGSAIIVTGSSASVTERTPWMLRTEAYLRDVVSHEQPLLGICFGHQLLAQALGGHVVRNPRGREIGTVRVKLRDEAAADPLFSGLPNELEVNATHVDTVSRLPEGAQLLATTALEPHAAFRVGEWAYGVQFHPEIDGDVMRGYVKAREPIIRDEGLPFDLIHSNITDGPHGTMLLQNFVKHVALRKRALT